MQLISKLTTILDLDRRTYEAGDDADLAAIAAAAGRLDAFQKRAADVAALRLKGNPMQTPAANARALLDWLDAARDAAGREFDAHRAKITAHVESLKDNIYSPLIQAGERGLLASEYRSIFRNLDGPGRDKYLKEAAENNDLPALGAVLGVSAMLSGLSPTELNLRRDTYARQAHGSTVERIANIERAQGRLDKAATLLVSRVSSLVDRKALYAAEADERALRAAEAA